MDFEKKLVGGGACIVNECIFHR